MLTGLETSHNGPQYLQLQQWTKRERLQFVLTRLGVLVF